MELPVYSNMFKTPVTSATLAELCCKNSEKLLLTGAIASSIGTTADQRDNYTPQTLSFC